MERYQCIAISIEQYELLTPLEEAVAETVALQEFFSRQLQIPQAQILFLSEDSTTIAGRSTYPSSQNIAQWLKYLTTKSENYHEDSLGKFWFFFRGYGMSVEGEDYLLPINAHSESVKATGIPLKTLFSVLKKICSATLIVLDLNFISKKAVPEGFKQRIGSLGAKMGLSIFFSARYAQIAATKPPKQMSVIHQALAKTFLAYSAEATWQNLIDSFHQVAATYEQNISLAVLPRQIVKRKLNLIRKQEKEHKNKLNPYLRGVDKQIIPNIRVIEAKNALWFSFLGILLTVTAIAGVSTWFPSQQRAKSSLKPNKEANLNEYISRKAKYPQIHPNVIYLPDYQAADLRAAITEALKIPPDNPYYPHAQANIAYWSWIIFDLAKTAAQQGDLKNAIATAKLIPPENSPIYQLAQTAIQQWEKGITEIAASDNLIVSAQKQIKPRQASSYKQGIAILRQIAPEDSNYQQAQALINQWSKAIYSIANSRAAQGNIEQAIDTAQLIPHNSSIYATAKQTINNWTSKSTKLIIHQNLGK